MSPADEVIFDLYDRIAALEAENQKLREQRMDWRDKVLEYEVRALAAEARVAELETALAGNYPLHRMQARAVDAEARVVELEQQLKEKS